MTLEQFGTLVKAMKAVYADPKFIADSDAVGVWYAMLKDLSYEQLSEAVKAYMQTEVYPPTIAGLRAKVQTLQPMGTTALEAWGMVRDAVSRSSYYYNEEYEKLPKDIQKSVGCPENLRDWAKLETSTLDTVIQSQFIKNYSAVQKRIDEAQRTSPDVSMLIEQIHQKQLAQRPVKEIEQKHYDTELNQGIQEKLDALYKKLGGDDE